MPELVRFSPQMSHGEAGQLGALAQYVWTNRCGQLRFGVVTGPPSGAQGTAHQALVSAAAVPLVSGSCSLGVLAIERTKGRKFDRSLLAQFAALSDRIMQELLESRASEVAMLSEVEIA